MLVVDDNPQLLDLMAEFLQGFGYTVRGARDGAEALPLFAAWRPALVITDLQMPKLDGLALMRAVKAASPRTEVLVITGHADLDSAVEALRQGAFDYLIKPVDLGALGRRVAHALERRRLIAEQEALLGELEARVEARTAALADSQLRLRALFDGITDSLLIVDRTFTILAANRAAARFSGTPVEDLIGQTCHSALFGREEPCEGCPVEQTFAHGQAASRALSRREPGGSVRYLEAASYPLAGEGERPAEVVEHLRNVTEKIHQARQLHHAEKLAAVGEFAAGMVHELRNALAVVDASAQLLLGYPNDRRQAGRPYLEAIRRNATAAERTLQELLAYARPREPVLEAVNVAELLDRACLLLNGECAQHSVEVTREVAADLPAIRGDPEQLQHVFLNLILNAAQAMEGGGTITIRAAVDPPGWVRVEVIDTGRGIPAAHLDRLFEPFFTTREEGTGLGLAIAHRHVEAHQGTLAVESEEGRGTRITVSLPAGAG